MQKQVIEFSLVNDLKIQKITDKNIIGAPDWIMEVVSKSTKSRDYFLKAGKYNDAGVREYWIVDPDVRKVTVYNHNDVGEFELSLYSFDDQIPIGIYSDLVADMAVICRI